MIAPQNLAGQFPSCYAGVILVEGLLLVPMWGFGCCYATEIDAVCQMGPHDLLQLFDVPSTGAGSRNFVWKTRDMRRVRCVARDS